MNNLPNPYEHDYQQEYQPSQHIQIEANQQVYDYYGQNYINNAYDDHEDILSQPSPSFKYFGDSKTAEDDARSQHVPRKTKKSNISGVHQKYLQSQHQSSQKQSFKSQRNFRTAKPLVTKFKKRTVQNEAAAQMANANPICDGLQALQIDSRKLKDEIVLKAQSGEEEKAAIFRDLGIKQPKVLGKAKTERELQILSAFLETGEMPSDYVNDFLLLIST